MHLEEVLTIFLIFSLRRTIKVRVEGVRIDTSIIVVRTTVLVIEAVPQAVVIGVDNDRIVGNLGNSCISIKGESNATLVSFDLSFDVVVVFLVPMNFKLLNVDFGFTMRAFRAVLVDCVSTEELTLVVVSASTSIVHAVNSIGIGNGMFRRHGNKDFRSVANVISEHVFLFDLLVVNIGLVDVEVADL